MKQCVVLRHVPFESIGLLEPLLLKRAFSINTLDVPLHRLRRADLDAADLVVVLGGPISAYDDHLYPFLGEELECIERRLSQRRATIGICLGAQLMARALGAKVYRGPQKEIGWSPLQLTEAGKLGPMAKLDGRRVLHWHGDTFDLPEGALLLASTDLTPHQAFAWGQHALGLQFHIEVTAQALEAWYVGHTLELSQWARMSIPALRAEGINAAAQLEPCAIAVLDAWLDTLLATE